MMGYSHRVTMRGMNICIRPTWALPTGHCALKIEKKLHIGALQVDKEFLSNFHHKLVNF